MELLAEASSDPPNAEAVKLLRGLQAMHNLGICHGDPWNDPLMVAVDGSGWRLIDLSSSDEDATEAQCALEMAQFEALLGVKLPDRTQQAQNPATTQP
ncbi:hypothetical protein WJX73_009808 [Symbiochloris irregularis]|uniref:Aminoglycoside phosphotransferase domain-containing protein n=1 Tax=Symbiochloris irregularis TaxID=706552 RepID=A0AAW1Q320_9CHLO